MSVFDPLSNISENLTASFIIRSLSSLISADCNSKNIENITFNGKAVKDNSTPKYLGVTLDRELSFRNHLNNVKHQST